MRKLRQVIQLIQVLALPGALRAFRTWKPFSITAFRMLHRLRSQGLTFNTILDGGANIGQFARAAAETYPAARIIAFEPLPDIAETLRHNLEDRPRVRVIPSALGRHDGTLTFHRNVYTLSSSALPLHKNHIAAFPDARPLETLTVPVARMDTLLAEETLSGPILLKLDLQGFEIEALKGAPALLKRVDYVLIETVFKPMYEGEALFEALYDYLRTAGFHFVRPIDFLADARGEIVQMDALFAQVPPSGEATRG